VTSPYDLIVRGGTVVDPSQGLHAPLDVAFSAGRVAHLAPQITGAQATETLDVPGCLVTPGLIDLHVHAFWGVSHYGIEPDPNFVARGATTVVDAGPAGAATFDGFRRYVIDSAKTRILARLNLSAQGMLVHLASSSARTASNSATVSGSGALCPGSSAGSSGSESAPRRA
jgi:dihydroorotase